MGGGLLAAITMFFGQRIKDPIHLAGVWSWILSFATVVIAGYTIEVNETFFGVGVPTAAGAVNDGIFTWFHQDIGLFLLPTLVLIMLVANGS